MQKHSIKEDWVAILVGTFLTAQGVYLLKSAGLITGGTAGLSLLLSQVTSYSFGFLYFTINIPFFLLAWQRYGYQFALNSVISSALVSVFVDHLDMVMVIESVNEIYCAVAGGVLIGLGMLVLFRHRSSLGGFNILCLLIQDKAGISVGKTQVVIDSVIVVASFFFVSPWIIALSVLGAIIINSVLGMNHKPSRYIVTYN
ncbi:YitT family protein [Vibrio sp. TH_r3]|uniref:YitT family protein n=1 Tax=Vibrio sp. TH_r3 TaxID=3082084 RepID=UPI0029555525|nr:YitT family protein [Vibrio sp. TH_r3]MDV7104779.1 YitT family protein [Vibrio sp. TH_r3]